MVNSTDNIANTSGPYNAEAAGALFERSAATFRAVLVEVRPEHHQLATPCEPLNVAELVVKAIGHQNWTRRAINGETGPPTYPAIAPDQWTGSFDESTAAMSATLADADAMERTVTLAGGLSFPGADVGLLAARNTFQFAWDLAVATEQSTDLTPDLAAELLHISRTHLVPQRGPNGFFGPEHVPPAGAPTATILAGYLGRPV
ncbi:MAG TPA: TIGR03086 family metal-binding protein [Ilumatobacteraceae bacterium]|nr:TIGR03086 family metal-binding protein [Ilumatobacteraceae bacterium]